MMESLPWYKQFWPWFLFGLPGIVVVAGLSTWYIAERGADQLVADEYYKDGLAINRELRKQELAQRRGLSAQIQQSGNNLEVRLTGDSDAPALTLLMSHPMDADSDFTVRLARIQPGVYRARLKATTFPRWLWQLEPAGVDATETWRLDGELVLNHADGD